MILKHSLSFSKTRLLNRNVTTLKISFIINHNDCRNNSTNKCYTFLSARETGRLI